MADERRLVAEIFKCRVADIYGAEEIGIIATDCPRCGAYHPAEDVMQFEVLREDGAAAQPGETGHVVVTSLRELRHAPHPLRARRRGRGGAGRPMPERRGQPDPHRRPPAKNMFTQVDGQKFLPYVALGEVASLGPIARFRFVQTSLTDDRVPLQTLRPGPASTSTSSPRCPANT